MDERELRQLLSSVRDGRTDVDDALLKLRMKPFDDLGYAKVDLQRGVRTGAAEVVFGAGKTAEQIAGIVGSMRENGQQTILVTRLDEDKEKKLREIFTGKADRAKTQPGSGNAYDETGAGDDAAGIANIAKDGSAACGTVPYFYQKEGRIAVIGRMPEPDGIGKILVLTAGTSDVPVAEEAAVTAEALGNEVVRVYDAGVAGLHRLLAHMPDIMGATVIIAIAGMEGALPAVVTGLADCPVIAVPTSVGYGTSLHGMSALLSMLNCCASGMCVENIDNGFGAAYFASMINHLKGYGGRKQVPGSRKEIRQQGQTEERSGEAT